jgi:ribose 5-phosphate isomerase B
MPDPQETLELEIRGLVRRIVDGILDAPGTAEVPSPVVQHEEVIAAPAVATIAVGADHGGYPLKERLAYRLRESGYTVVDCGTDSPDTVDYPDFAHAVARKVAEGECAYGIVVDGAGIGSAIAANKVPGVRAAPCYDISTARNSREHNHANVLTLGAALIGDGLAWQIVEEWLAVPWGGGRHARRVEKISGIEHTYLRTAS